MLPTLNTILMCNVYRHCVHVLLHVKCQIKIANNYKSCHVCPLLFPCLILCCYCLGTPNRYIQKCVASPVYEGTNLAKTTRSVLSTSVPLSNISQTSSLNSNHSSQSVSVHPQVVVCPPVTPPSSPPPPPSFSPPLPSPQPPLPPSLSLPRPPPPSLPLPSPPSPKGLSVPAGREPPNSPAMVGSPYEKVL